MNKILAVGIFFLVSGAALSEVAYYVWGNMSLCIVGLVCMIFGAIVIQIPTFATRKRRLRALVEGGYNGVEKLLTAKNLKTPAIYLPPNGGASLVYVGSNTTVDSAADVESIKGAVDADLNGRGVVFPAPGSVSVNMASNVEANSLEDLLSMVLVKELGAAESVRSDVRGDDVEVVLVKPWRVKKHSLCESSLGSVSVSVVGSSLSAWFKSPVAYVSETISGDKTVAHFIVIKYRKTKTQ